MTGILICRKTIRKRDPAYRSAALHILAASSFVGRELSYEKGRLTALTTTEQYLIKNKLPNHSLYLMEEFQDYRYILDDFQHQVENKIRNHKDEPGFPKMEGKLSQQELDDYLFDHQAALDTAGTERTQYTIAGVLITLPIIILSGFSEESLPVKGYQVPLMGVAIGLVLYFIYRVVMKTIVNNKVKRAKKDHPEACEYVEKVMNF